MINARVLMFTKATCYIRQNKEASSIYARVHLIYSGGSGINITGAWSAPPSLLLRLRRFPKVPA